jgi:hypothetical protein
MAELTVFLERNSQLCYYLDSIGIEWKIYDNDNYIIVSRSIINNYLLENHCSLMEMLVIHEYNILGTIIFVCTKCSLNMLICLLNALPKDRQNNNRYNLMRFSLERDDDNPEHISYLIDFFKPSIDYITANLCNQSTTYSNVKIFQYLYSLVKNDQSVHNVINNLIRDKKIDYLEYVIKDSYRLKMDDYETLFNHFVVEDNEDKTKQLISWNQSGMVFINDFLSNKLLLLTALGKKKSIVQLLMAQFKYPKCVIDTVNLLLNSDQYVY